MGGNTLSSSKRSRASLVVQWLGICLAMQRTWFQSLVREDAPCHGATKPVGHNYWAPILEPVLRNKRMKSPLAVTRENKGPAQPKTNKLNFKKIASGPASTKKKKTKRVRHFICTTEVQKIKRIIHWQSQRHYKKYQNSRMKGQPKASNRWKIKNQLNKVEHAWWQNDLESGRVRLLLHHLRARLGQFQEMLYFPGSQLPLSLYSWFCACPLLNMLDTRLSCLLS